MSEPNDLQVGCGLRIVPSCLSESIYKQIDAAIAATDDPENAALDRENMYHQLLDFFDENGYIPEFSLARTAQ